MFEIKIKVKGNGTLEWGNSGRLRLGTTGENQRIKLVFDVDSIIEGSYQYFKFSHKRVAYLYRVYNKQLVLSRSIIAFDGIWKMSFISTNAVITNNQITGSYAFITEPAEAIVVKGILGNINPTEEEIILKGLCEMNYTNLEIPESVSAIGDYFMYNSKKTFNLRVGSGVTSIGSYAFYDAIINSLVFDDYSSLTTMKENSLYKIVFNCDIVFPKSITTWTKGTLQTSTVGKISFEPNSNLRVLGAYAFREIKVSEIYLPDRLLELGSNAIKSCSTLTKLWIPNTIVSTIPHTAIAGCPLLSNIELEANFGVDAYFDNCDLTEVAIVNMLYALKNRRSITTGKLILGSSNLAKISDTQKAIAINKNWTLS